MGSIEAFAQAMKLDTGALRFLLDSGRPEQRVWAMWALALRQQGVADLIVVMLLTLYWTTQSMRSMGRLRLIDALRCAAPS